MNRGVAMYMETFPICYVSLVFMTSGCFGDVCLMARGWFGEAGALGNSKYQNTKAV